MSNTDDTGMGRSANFIPEYQERFLKDLLANIYQPQLDAEGNVLLDESGQPIVTGIAADSPLYGTPVLDEQGNQVFETDPATGEPLLDFRGQPIPMVEGGIRRPDVAPLTPNQLEAIRLAESGVGAFGPMFDQAQAAFGGFELDDQGNVVTDAQGNPIRTGAIGQIGEGVSTLGEGVTELRGTTGLYDTATRRGATDPIFSDFSEDVIGDTATDIGTASSAIGTAATTGATGVRGAGAGIAGQVGAAQTGADIAAQRARDATAQAQRDLSGAGAFGLGAAAEGISRLDDTTGAFDPQGIGAFMNQYEDAAVQQAIQDIARAGQMQRNELGAQAVGAGAFGGSREAVAQQELGRNILEQQGRTAAGMRQAGFESAAQRAQQAFEAQQGRGQSAAQLRGQLGQAGAGTAMDAAEAAGRLGLSAEQLAQTGALQGGQLGLSGQTNLADLLSQAAGLEMQGAGAQADLSMGLAGLRGTGFEMAQNLGQSAFEDQMRRGQNASQIFGSLGQGLGSLAGQQTDIGVRQAALGEAAQQAGQSDVNALFNIGALEQGQMQSEYDVQRQADIEEAYEPFQRFAYMSDIFRGVPSTQSSMTVSSVPSPSPVSNILGMAQGIGGYQQATGQGIFG
jgi:hypothetical protein